MPRALTAPTPARHRVGLLAIHSRRGKPGESRGGRGLRTASHAGGSGLLRMRGKRALRVCYSPNSQETAKPGSLQRSKQRDRRGRKRPPRGSRASAAHAPPGGAPARAPTAAAAFRPAPPQFAPPSRGAAGKARSSGPAPRLPAPGGAPRSTIYRDAAVRTPGSGSRPASVPPRAIRRSAAGPGCAAHSSSRATRVPEIAAPPHRQCITRCDDRFPSLLSSDSSIRTLLPCHGSQAYLAKPP